MNLFRFKKYNKIMINKYKHYKKLLKIITILKNKYIQF